MPNTTSSKGKTVKGDTGQKAGQSRDKNNQGAGQGFQNMNPEKHREISRKGGKS